VKERGEEERKRDNLDESHAIDIPQKQNAILPFSKIKQHGDIIPENPPIQKNHQ